MRWMTLMGVVFVLVCPALGATFYVDPAVGRDDGDGSAARPWRTLQAVVEAGQLARIGPGDTVVLGTGDHGTVRLRGLVHDEAVTVEAAPGAAPVLRRLVLQGCAGWVFRGLTLTPDAAGEHPTAAMIDIDNHAHHGDCRDIVIEGCELFTVRDTSGWTKADWVARAASGVTSDGADVTIRNNTLTNVRFGISASGPRSVVAGNVVRNFSGDALRGLGDDSGFEGNYVANCYDVDDNHDDGFQSWSMGEDEDGRIRPGRGVVRNVTLRGNVIVNFEDPAQPHRGPLQGIGCFDGMYEGWVVENNVVIVDHWHGITLMGARGCRVVNNTVVDAAGGRPGPAWVRVDPHKDGRVGAGNVVRNNLAAQVVVGEGTTADHNVALDDPAAMLRSAAPPWDVRPVAGSPAIDAGTAEGAPATDIDGGVRPRGEAVDAGAYEVG